MRSNFYLRTDNDLHLEPWKESTPTEASTLQQKSTPSCAEMLRKISPNDAELKVPMCGLLNFQPRLSFQLEKRHIWNQRSTFVAFNVWRPPYAWGISLDHLTPSSITLYRKDLILTDYAEDTELIKNGDKDNISFTKANVRAVARVEEPSFLACRCCFQPRGKIYLANGECWEHKEQDVTHHMFTRRQKTDSGTSEASKTLVWQAYEYSELKGLPEDRPILLNRNSRVCRICDTSFFTEDFSNDVLAIMNPDGIIFCEESESIDGVRGLETDDLRTLVVMTGLATANYDQGFKL